MKENNTRYFIDTNIFLRIIVEDSDKKQIEGAKLFLEALRAGRIKGFTSALVLAEVNWVLSSFYKLSKELIIPYLAGIASLKHLRFEDAYEPAYALRLWGKYGIKFVDCLIVSSPSFLKGNVILVSYDKDFDKIEGITRQEPREVIK